MDTGHGNASGLTLTGAREVARFLKNQVSEEAMLKPRPAHVSPAQRVVLVNGDPDVVRMLDTVLASGHYDMVFVPPDGRAYEQIRQVRPDLVVLRSELRTAADLEILTMLKLDPATRDIPVMTIAVEAEDEPAPALDEVPAPGDTLTAGPQVSWLN